MGSIDPPVAQVVPFFALGVGIDDMLVCLHYFSTTKREGLRPPEVVAKGLTHAWSIHGT